ncbi:hypothetical protein CY35_04G094700 [Sphagnum magellanicum]|nr:hypothetical protein CY35_04G094700 [Sphagnum magellanicum]KAH9565766.1 hypothetical protein CY35_04G094700 [Sphagnum magellanicum]KAH9565767.1 hypothetical protein CY35_04G094700 [Sphagnum magellanicum]KAH9565768.1 hypothetical protein CY35_04G094700 [Sphagnum magellanicum]KAH9565769.1 hypothetical protein CY35_04G094700 [Sphagnum magellanicum]
MDTGVVLPRKQADYICRDERYCLSMQRYKGQQYSQLYFFRLHTIRQNLLSRVQERWPSLPVCKVLGLEEGQLCVVVGTLYKQMQLKPSILEEYSKERSVVPLATPSKFTHNDDYLIMEDESGRVKLIRDANLPSFYVTGVVVAVCGKEEKDGEFFVQEILEPGLPPQIPLPSAVSSDEEKFVVFASGLKIGGESTNPLELQLLLDHLTGHLGEEEEQSLSSQIVRVVIAGGSVDLQTSLSNGQPLSGKEQTKLVEPIRELDLALTQLAAAMPVDIMPGPNDPANYSLPQQPLHRCLFPGASLYNTFVSATNPHQFELDGALFLGTSGQNIEDLEKYSEAEERLDFMERTLVWRHLAPTAPDTLGCYPFTDRDPFIVEMCPHVYFCGNQPSYASRLLKGPSGQQVRLICIPSFQETSSVVLVSLKTWDSHILTFSANSFQP